MLEILRVLSQRETRLRHSVLFLFNGAEETPLQAAHGFITQHPWAKNIRGTRQKSTNMKWTKFVFINFCSLLKS